jgi:hypothetical protein
MSKPLPVGISEGFVTSPDQVEDKRLKLEGAKFLGEMTEDYHFFTPGLVYQTVKLRKDLPSMYVDEFGTELEQFTIKFDKPIFGGFDTLRRDWNYVLYAMRIADWKKFLPWVGSITCADTPSKILYRVRSQDTGILDPLHGGRFLDVSEEQSLLKISMFCVESNRGSWYFRRKPDIYATPPSVMFSKDIVYRDTIDMANKLFKTRQKYGDAK